MQKFYDLVAKIPKGVLEFFTPPREFKGGFYSNTIPEVAPAGPSIASILTGAATSRASAGAYGGNLGEATVNIKVSADPGTTATVEDSHGRGGTRVKVDTVGYVGWGDLIR
jgi:hypothetical protein